MSEQADEQAQDEQSGADKEMVDVERTEEIHTTTEGTPTPQED